MNLKLKSQISKIKSHSILFEELIIENNDKTERLAFLREKATQSFIIDVYTFWESTIKEKIFDTLKKNSFLIMSDKFISKYSKDALAGNRIVKEKFVNSFKEKKLYITKEIICDSNNLDYEALFKLLNKIFLDLSKEELSAYFLSDSKLMNSVRILKIEGVEKEESPFDVTGYLNLVVMKRNIVAHTHEIDTLRYNKKQREAIIYFIEELTKSIFSLIESILINKRIEVKEPHNQISVETIYKCNRENEYGLMALNFNGYTGDKKAFEHQLFLKYFLTDRLGSIIQTHYIPITINEIRNENSNKCRTFPNHGKRSISFNSRKIIKSDENYEILKLEKNSIQDTPYGLEVIIESLDQ